LGQHPEIFNVYLACPGDDTDEVLLPLDHNFFGKLFAIKFDNNFVDEQTIKSPLTPKPLEQF
jgi:hypothetical protein